MSSKDKRIKRNELTGKLYVADAPKRIAIKCLVCDRILLIAPGEKANYHKYCRKLRQK